MNDPEAFETFERVWAYMKDIPGSFTGLNAEKLYQCAKTIRNGLIVEVGVDQGRSTSTLLYAAKTTRSRLILVDSWESILIENMHKVLSRLRKDFPEVIFALCRLTSIEAANLIKEPIDMVHIDANHLAPNPDQDCEVWLPKLKSGGIACFHDCLTPCFPAVDAAVARYTKGWEDLGTWEGLGIRRKP